MSTLDASEQRTLLDVASAAIGAELFDVQPAAPVGVSPHLCEPGASFVTLERGEALLGCIGTIEPVRPLIDDVAHNARQSAFDDPRLPAVSVEDFGVMSVKVSVLSPLEAMGAGSFDEVVAWLRAGTDGLLLEGSGRRATFLPSVWNKLPDERTFVRQLLHKAGIDDHRWPVGARAWRYTTDELVDAGPRPTPA